MSVGTIAESQKAAMEVMSALRCLSNHQAHVQSRPSGNVDQRIEAELADSSLEQRIQARLRKSQRPGRRRLGHPAPPIEIVDPHHQLGAKPEVLRLSLIEAEVQKDVSAASRDPDLLA